MSEDKDPLLGPHRLKSEQLELPRQTSFSFPVLCYAVQFTTSTSEAL